MRKTRAPRPTPSAPPAAPEFIDRLWVQVLAALWIGGIVVYFCRVQVVRLFEILAR